MNNLLITKGINLEIFFQNRDKKDWEIFDLKQFIKKLKNLKKKNFQQIAVGYQDLREGSFKYPIEFIFLFFKSPKKYFIDNQGNIEKFSLGRFIFIDTPLFFIELIFDLLLVIVSWVILPFFYFLPKKQPQKRPDSKIIFYLRTDNFRGQQQGGSFTHFRGVVKAFSELGYTIHYIGSGKIQVPGLNFPQNIVPYPLKFNLPEIPEIYYNWRFIPRASKIIKRENPLFIYQRHSIFNVCGAVLSQLTGIPLILEYNGSEPWIRQKWGGLLIFKRLCHFMENISLKKADIISVVSEAMRDELLKRGIAEKKILVNYNGVDIEKFSPQIDGSKIRKKYKLKDDIVIGAVSTFGAWHGMPVLAKAVKIVIEAFKVKKPKSKIRFLFIGDGVERPQCERIIQESGIEEYVIFTGIVPFKEVPLYLAACDILVSPHIPNPDGTPFFGSPTKLFEYMAMGKGIVASDLSQIGKVLCHKKTAWLVRPGDVNDLADGIMKLIENKKLREELGQNARNEVIKSYTWRKNVKRIIGRFYENGVEKR